MKLRYTIRARRHLEVIASHISKDNPDAARRVVSTIREAVARLERYPESGRKVSRRGRELVLSSLPYVVVYRIGPDAVDILSVFHAARHPAVRSRP